MKRTISIFLVALMIIGILPIGGLFVFGEGTVQVFNPSDFEEVNYVLTKEKLDTDTYTSTWTYTYDSKGNEIEEAYTSTDSSSETYTYTYDVWGILQRGHIILFGMHPVSKPSHTMQTAI